MHSVQELDLSKYENRLRTFSNFPPAIPVFIKDLVEAGFSSTGNGSLVFCFACGFMYDEWQDGDNPRSVHLKANGTCLYLMAKNSYSKPPVDYSKHDTFYWDVANRCLVKRDRISGQTLKVAHSMSLPFNTSSDLRPPVIYSRTKSDSGSPGCSSQSRKDRFPPIDKSAGYENVPTGIDSLAELEKTQAAVNLDGSHPLKYQMTIMRNTASRLRSFTVHFPLLDRPELQKLADAGFFYYKRGAVAKCFTCGLEVNDWQMFHNPTTTHYEKCPECPFIRALIRQSQLLEDRSAGASAIDNEQENEEIHPVATHSGSYVPTINSSKTLIQECSIKNTVTETDAIREDLIHSPPVSTRPLRLSTSEIKIVPTTNRAPTRSVSHMYHSYLPDMSTRDARLQTFSTWPQESPVAPFDLAGAGFFYTGYKDGVKCFKCGIALKDWCPGDTAWGEHKKWAPNCSYVLSYSPRLPMSVRSESLPEQSLHMRSTDSILFDERPQSSTYDDADVSCSQHIMENDQGSEEVILPESELENSEHATATPLRTLIDGKCIANSEVLQNLLDMGYTVNTIAEVKDMYFSEHGSYFANPDELVEGILCVQECGSLKNFAQYANQSANSLLTQHNDTCKASETYGDLENNNTGAIQIAGREGKETMSLESLGNNTCKNDEALLCIICMDRDRCVVFIPCGHLSSCQDCSRGLKDCPVCRVPIERCQRTFLT